MSITSERKALKISKTQTNKNMQSAKNVKDRTSSKTQRVESIKTRKVLTTLKQRKTSEHAKR